MKTQKIILFSLEAVAFLYFLMTNISSATSSLTDISNSAPWYIVIAPTVLLIIVGIIIFALILFLQNKLISGADK